MTQRSIALRTDTQKHIEAIADRYEVGMLEIALRDRADDFELLVRLGELYARANRYEDALAINLRLIEIAPLDPIAHYNLACSQSRTGRLEDALKSLVRAVRHGYSEIDHLMQDPDMEDVRSHPVFPEILRMVERQSSRIP